MYRIELRFAGRTALAEGKYTTPDEAEKAMTQAFATDCFKLEDPHIVLSTPSIVATYLPAAALESVSIVEE